MIYYLGPSFIRSNQSATRPRKQQEAEIKNLHDKIFNKVKDHLMQKPHCIPKTNVSFNKYSEQLLNYLNRVYFTPLPYKDQIQANEQAKMVASIRKIIETQKLIIRVTDKSNHFYIGSAMNFEEKAQKYFNQTNAFIELTNNPFKEILNNVCQFLNKLATNKLILQKQCKQMLPDRDNAQLAHLYFNPKIHKVESIFSFSFFQ